MKTHGYGLTIIALLVLSIMMALFFVTPPAQAASLTETSVTDYRGFSVHDLTVTADSGGASAVAMTYAINGVVIAVETDPGTTAPTDNYDMTITDAFGADIMGGALSNRDTATTEIAYPLSGSVVVEAPTTGIKTIRVTAASNLVKSATVRLRIFTKDEKKGVLSW